MAAQEVPLNALSPGKGAGSGRPCAICQLPLKVRSALEERIARGESVKSTWRWAQKQFPEVSGTNYDTLARHQRLHVGPIRRAAKKLSDADRLVRQKIKLARDVLADKVDPEAFFGPAQLAQDIAKTENRLNVAADDALVDRQHASLASLSGALIRAYELRGKLGGAISDRTEVNLSVSLNELHSRLDSVLGADQADRQKAARALLGLASPQQTLAAQADPPALRRSPGADTTNPLGDPLTIDGVVVSHQRLRDARLPLWRLPEPAATVEARLAGLPESGNGIPASFEEPVGALFRGS